jgi:hypothetical protein
VLSALIGVLIICVIGAMCFWDVDDTCANFLHKWREGREGCSLGVSGRAGQLNPTRHRESVKE